MLNQQKLMDNVLTPAFDPLQIRRQMIDGRSGEKTIKTLIKSLDEASVCN